MQLDQHHGELRRPASITDRNGEALPRLKGHIYSDEEGLYPVDLNNWEAAVIQAEIARPGFEAWYRNPSRPTTNALRIAYQNESRKWSSLQVDYIVVARRDDGSLVASIIDPHGDHLADALSKLRALADYARLYGDRFARIESINQVDGDRLRVLDMKSPLVRDAIRDFSGGRITPLYESEIARDFR